MATITILDEKLIVHEDGTIYMDNGEKHLQFDNGKGYKFIMIKRRTKYVHRIVLAAFTGKPYEYEMVVNHKDYDRANNHVSNLEWLTREKNAGNRRATKLTECDVAKIRRMFSEGYKRKEIARVFNITHGYAVLIINNKARTKAS